MEHIVCELLANDILDENSLVWHVLFDCTLREEILKELDGKPACWSKDCFLDIKDDPENKNNNFGQSKQTHGTHFFWGIDPSSRRIPLFVLENPGGIDKLVGKDDNDLTMEVDIEPRVILSKIKNRELLPSLFISYLILAFTRGMVCLGGYYQAKYLPLMQIGLVNALKKARYSESIIKTISSIKTDSYLSGMQAVMINYQKDHLIPAGPVEIISRGGLTVSDIEKISDLSVRDAHFASLHETIPDLFSNSQNFDPDWRQVLAKICFTDLKGKLVVI